MTTNEKELLSTIEADLYRNGFLLNRAMYDECIRGLIQLRLELLKERYVLLGGIYEQGKNKLRQSYEF